MTQKNILRSDNKRNVKNSIIFPQVGFEPTMVRLMTNHSTTEQLWYRILRIKLVMYIMGQKSIMSTQR